MLVDDNRQFLEVVHASLMQMPGLDLQLARSGRECLTLVKQSLPDTVFLDIVMENMNGLVTARFLKSLYPSIRVIFVTGHSPADVAKYFDLRSIDGFFTKTDFIDLINSRQLFEFC